jgi:hypothetical protein
MPTMIAVGVGSVVLVAVGVWAWLSRERDSNTDLGTISGQWINEHRAQERQSNNR